MEEIIDCYGLFGYDRNFNRIFNIKFYSPTKSSEFIGAHRCNIKPPVPKLYESPVPKLYESPVPRLYESPVPRLYESPVPRLYETPVPELYEPPSPESFNSLSPKSLSSSLSDPLSSFPCDSPSVCINKALIEFNRDDTTQECKYDNKCSIKDCRFSHPLKWAPKWIPNLVAKNRCKYGNKCYSPKCRLSHLPGWSSELAKKTRSQILCSESPCTIFRCGFKHVVPKTELAIERW